jgi:hypothetical protein
MKSFKSLLLAGAVALVAALGVSSAQAGSGRQHYAGWQHSGRGYSFCTYYYKPSVGYPSYCYNYAIWYPSTPNYVYYFNPYRGTYWGRFDIKTKGYSLLAEKDRAGQLKDIPEKAFPAEGPLPSVPDAKDKVQLAEPPDLPVADKTVVKERVKAGVAEQTPPSPDKEPDALTTTPADSSVDPLTSDKPAATGTPAAAGTPATSTPAGNAAQGGPAGATAPVPGGDAAVPAGTGTPNAGTVAPVDGQVVDAKPGVGVVPPTEPVAPVGGATPAGGVAPVGGVVTGGTPTPVGGFVTGSPVQAGPNGFPYYYHNCRRQHVCR